MRHHLQATGVRPATIGLLLVLTCAAWLALAQPEVPHQFPAPITSGLTAITAAITSTVLRRPLGDLGSTTARVGDATTAGAALVLWLVASVLLTTASATQGLPLGLATARASLGMAGLALLGLAVGGPGLGIGAPLAMAVGTAVVARNAAEPPAWAWNLDAPGALAWTCLAATLVAAAAALPHVRNQM